MREGFFKSLLFGLVVLGGIGLGIWTYMYQHQYDPLYDAIDPQTVERYKATTTAEISDPAPGTCALTVDGAQYLISPCSKQDNGQYGIDFGVQAPGSKYFIYGVNTTDEVGGWWNGAGASSHAHDPLPGGKLTKAGNCYQNSRVRLCESGQ